MFKFVVLCALVAAASAVNKFGHNAHSGARTSVHSAPSSDDVHAEVTSFASDVRADGFNYGYDTTNGIHDAASGDVNGNIQGDFSWTSPEGEHIAVQYVADENGFQPNSDVLPTPPPVPAAILKALEYIRTHPAYVEPASSAVHSASNNFAHKPAKNNRRF